MHITHPDTHTHSSASPPSPGRAPGCGITACAVGTTLLTVIRDLAACAGGASLRLKPTFGFPPNRRLTHTHTHTPGRPAARSATGHSISINYSLPARLICISFLTPSRCSFSSLAHRKWSIDLAEWSEPLFAHLFSSFSFVLTVRQVNKHVQAAPPLRMINLVTSEQIIGAPHRPACNWL